MIVGVDMKNIKTIDQLNQSESKWLIDGLLLDKTIAAVIAPPKTFKTMLLFEIAMSAVLGERCLNHYNTNRSIRVLLANLEDTESIQRERLELMLKTRGVKSVPNLGILTMSDRLLLDTEQGIQSLRASIEDFKPELVILDPFCRAVSTVSENDSRGVAEVLYQLRKIRDDYDTGIVLAHHAAKGSNNKRAGDRARGSSEFFAWAESLISLKKSADGQVTLDCEHRAAPSTQDVQIELNADTNGISLQVKNQPTVFAQTIQRTPDEIVLNAIQSRISPVPFEALAQTTKLTDGELRSTLYRAIKTGVLKYTPQGYLRRECQ
jgi:RecA-family ATPase